MEAKSKPAAGPRAQALPRAWESPLGDNLPGNYVPAGISQDPESVELDAVEGAGALLAGAGAEAGEPSVLDGAAGTVEAASRESVR